VPIVVWAALDRIEFYCGTIARRGPLALLVGLVTRTRQQVAVSDIETITTEATSLSFSSGDARLIYRTQINGGGVQIVVRSHRASYISFIKALFEAAGPQKLDPRSYELWSYLETHNTLVEYRVLRNEIAAMPVPVLRRVGNALKLAGRLAQASSYFRSAYEKEPRNPELLYEMSRFFHSSALTQDHRLLQRSDACLRLASRLAGPTPDLLERIGEAFVERLDYKRASDCFRRALAFDPARYRANLGLAEIALRDGKLAHVAHYYNRAAHSDDAAIARMARREARYYERLIGDDDFLEKELRRIQLANQFRLTRRLSALTFFSAWLTAGVVGRFFPTVEEFGWAVMAMSGLVWLAASLTLRLLTRRPS
jgi:tetratricopeptide (TPR) repeat protein